MNLFVRIQIYKVRGSRQCFPIVAWFSIKKHKTMNKATSAVLDWRTDGCTCINVIVLPGQGNHDMNQRAPSATDQHTLHLDYVRLDGVGGASFTPFIKFWKMPNPLPHTQINFWAIHPKYIDFHKRYMQIYSGESRKFMKGWGWGGFLVVWRLFWYSPPHTVVSSLIWSPQIHMYMYSYLLQAHRQEFPKEVLLRQKPWISGISVWCKILQSSSFQALYSNLRKVSPVFQNWFLKISIKF